MGNFIDYMWSKMSNSIAYIWDNILQGVNRQMNKIYGFGIIMVFIACVVTAVYRISIGDVEFTSSFLTSMVVNASIWMTLGLFWYSNTRR